ncbi:MFS transporter [Desulfobulbus sp.]|uniref:MFS transporter n=1 Tax=Desulfobulbus sp. TaxID=895 RepID=UPI00286F4801|nr:MFS transporter [Desulfobulbus sp.]
MPAPAPFPRSWRKQAALFLVSQNLSLFGSAVVGFALVWHITLQTTSGLWMTLATIACNVPQIVLLPWGGVWADRYSRRWLIMCSDGLVALATLALAFVFMAGSESLFLILGVLALRSLGGGVQAPASAALYTQLVPPERLNQVQGINQTVNAVLMLLSPAAGGLLLGSVNLAWAMMVDVVTATAAIGVLWCIEAGHAAQNVEPRSARAEMLRGLSFMFETRALRLFLFCYAAFFFLVAPAAVLSPLMIARSFGGEVWRLTANELAWSGMSILGGAFIAWRGEYADKPRAIAFCVTVFGLLVGLLGFVDNFAVYLVIIGLAGFIMPVFATTSTVFVQQTADPAMLGRVFSIVQIVAASGLPLAILVFGPLADAVSVESLMVATGFPLALAGLFYRHLSRR